VRSSKIVGVCSIAVLIQVTEYWAKSQKKFLWPCNSGVHVYRLTDYHRPKGKVALPNFASCLQICATVELGRSS